MPSLKANAHLQQFVEDELMRAPLLVEQLLEGTLEQIGRALPGATPAERSLTNELVQHIQAQRQRLVQAYGQSLREQVTAELAGKAPAEPAVAAPGRAARQALSLVDEDAVAVDVVISQAIESIKSVAEYELRELITFTAALVGDMDVAKDHNPFRAETHARALWAASQALPLSRGHQVAFMRHAGMPLAQVLRRAYASASARLESMGVEPAAYRTLILPAGARRSRNVHDTTFVPELHRIRETMPVPLDGVPEGPELDQVLKQSDEQWRSLPANASLTEHGRLRDLQRTKLVHSAPTRVDQQTIELFSRLFDAILGDRRLPQDFQLLISRLQPSVLRVALRDPSTLDNEQHPVWEFIDRVAFFGETLPESGDPVREGVVRYFHALIDKLIDQPHHDANLYRSALERVRSIEQQALAQRCQTADEQIAALQALEDKLVASKTQPSTMHGALDVAQLDTVPADLIAITAAEPKSPSISTDWLAGRQPGDWVRMFMRGDWVHAQLLWIGDRNELWLFADREADTTWAIRRPALVTMYAESLLDLVKPRSLIRSAAKKVARRMARAEAA